MPNEVGDSEGVAEPELADRILDAFDERNETALSTRAVADAVDVDEETAADCLDRLADDGELTKVDLGSEYVGWERATETFVGHAQGGSYRISDPRTGLVTRASDRATALRSLADKIDLLEDGSHIGAQILGICETEIGPGYFDSVEELLESYVRPDDRHIYVYVADEGVTEIETASQLTREQTILGFTITAVFDREEFSEVMVVPAERAIEASALREDHFPVGVFKATAVHPEHQREGVGTALASHGLAYLAQTPPVLTVLWIREDEATTRLAHKFGGEELARFEDVDLSDRQCPQCGFDTDCTCTFALYSWGLDQDGA